MKYNTCHIICSRTPPGDLFVIVHSIPDDRFERAGADLWREETLEVEDAVLGVRLKVPTLQGDVEVRCRQAPSPTRSCACAARACRNTAAADVAA
ncbi:MAG: DnaJ C-terminal domain-containing protein [Gammaproteobacteria bacterium]|jgi:molecular chaperone DnaJ